MSIFVSIASYRDPELIRTVNSAIENAYNPEDITFGLVIQEFPKKMPDFSHIKNVKVFEMSPKLARGAGYARSIAMEMYDKEDYFMQVDSHTVFTKGWDLECIKQLNEAENLSGNNRIILSAFPQPYIIENNKVTILKTSKDYDVVPMKQIPFQRSNGDWFAKRIKFDSDNHIPELSTTVLAGFIFTYGNIVEEVPYDPEISFMGEELCFAVRAWTRGWDIYSPKKVILYHYYVRPTYSKIWTDSNVRNISWKELESLSKQKQIKVLCGIEQGKYGLGNNRSIDEYEKITNINFHSLYFPNQDASATIDKTNKG